jgi:transglutaminase-like putative cysteine protease
MKRFLSIILVSALLYACGDSVSNMLPTIEQIDQTIEKGNFIEAEKMIRLALTNSSLTPAERWEMNFKIERMNRIERDFSVSDTSVYNYIRKFHPELSSDEIDMWETNNAIENMVINGEKRYFHSAGRNLFRIDTSAAKYYEGANGRQSDSLDRFLAKYLPVAISNLSSPVRMKIRYTLTVKADEVPEGEIIRVWMPYPRTDASSHKEIKLISTSQPLYTIAPDEYLHKSIYMEGVAKSGEPSTFGYELSYSSYNQYFSFSPEDIKEYKKESDLYKEYTAECGSHIRFSDNIKKAVEEAIGEETNPYLKVKRIFTWINSNFPWASAREYSTIENIPEYVLTNRHGDCGQVSLLFITMARYAGIPAKWESGWMMHPGNKNLHDWSEVYYEGVGWVPVDQSFGRVFDAPDEESHWFFTKGLDAFRMIVNEGVSAPFYPAKIHPRSETVDFQRGEVEWRGENLYFGRWRYKMEIEYLTPLK